MKLDLKITMFAVALAMTQAAHAGVTKFNSDEFNAIISENLKAEHDLRDQLHAAGGLHDTKKDLDPNFAEKGRQLVGVAPAENVVAATTDHHDSKFAERNEKRLNQESLKRVSQEIEAMENE